MSKFLPKRGEMEFEGGLSEAITAHAGVTLLIELGRISQVMATAERCLPAKKSPKGLEQGQFVGAPRRILIRPGVKIPSSQRPSQPAGIESCVVEGNKQLPRSVDDAV